MNNKYKLLYKTTVFLSIIGLVLPNFSLVLGQGVPKNISELKELGEKGVQQAKEKLLSTLEKIWKENVLPVWTKMYFWFKEKIWEKIVSWFKTEAEPKTKEEFEKRKPIIEEEFEKEKEEVKEEIPKVGRSLWEKFQEIIK